MWYIPVGIYLLARASGYNTTLSKKSVSSSTISSHLRNSIGLPWFIEASVLGTHDLFELSPDINSISEVDSWKSHYNDPSTRFSFDLRFSQLRDHADALRLFHVVLGTCGIRIVMLADQPLTYESQGSICKASVLQGIYEVFVLASWRTIHVIATV